MSDIWNRLGSFFNDAGSDMRSVPAKWSYDATKKITGSDRAAAGASQFLPFLATGAGSNPLSWYLNFATRPEDVYGDNPTQSQRDSYRKGVQTKDWTNGIIGGIATGIAGGAALGGGAAAGTGGGSSALGGGLTSGGESFGAGMTGTELEAASGTGMGQWAEPAGGTSSFDINNLLSNQLSKGGSGQQSVGNNNWQMLEQFLRSQQRNNNAIQPLPPMKSIL